MRERAIATGRVPLGLHEPTVAPPKVALTDADLSNMVGSRHPGHAIGLEPFFRWV